MEGQDMREKEGEHEGGGNKRRRRRKDEDKGGRTG